MVQRGKDAAMRGCTNGVINGGVSHGATKKGCNHEGCPNQAKKGHKHVPTRLLQEEFVGRMTLKRNSVCSFEGCPL